MGNKLVFLKNDQVILTGRHLGRPFESSFSLQQLSPEYQQFSRVYPTFVYFPLVLLVGLFFLCHILLSTSVPAWTVLAPSAGIAIFLFIQFGKSVRPLTVVRFFDHRGQIKFDFVGEPEQREDCLSFARQLSELIRSRA